MEKSTRALIVPLVLALFLTGCDIVSSPAEDQEVDSAENSFQPLTVIGDEAPEGLRVGVFRVCKSAPEADAQTFTFSTSAEGPNAEQAAIVATTELANGECVDVYEITGEVEGADEVTITEEVPSGWEIDGVTIQLIDEEGNVTSRDESGPAIQEVITADTRGALATYTNIPASVEPPPGEPRGGEGCTPGAWKNRLLRLERWPISENTLVSEVWDVPPAFEENTLLNALRGGGGPSFDDKVGILLRAATAAYLNALTIDYDLTTEEIVDSVNAAIASGDPATVITLAEELDGFNNQDCPITERDYQG